MSKFCTYFKNTLLMFVFFFGSLETWGAIPQDIGEKNDMSGDTHSKELIKVPVKSLAKDSSTDKALLLNDVEEKDIPVNFSKKDATSDSEFLDVSSIRDVIKNDLLEKEVSEKNTKLKLEQEAMKEKEIAEYLFPTEEDLFQFLSEYWVVKNAQILGYDVERPDFGIGPAFVSLLEKLGHVQLSFKILIVDNSVTTHYALPTRTGEYLFILSLPFVRSMDLTKVEIALLLFEDFLRREANYFKQYVYEKELDNWIGKNFFEKKLIDKTLVEKVLHNYSNLIFNKGFTFQQQFDVTKMMINTIEKNSRLVDSYKNLLHKIDGLVKTNPKFKDYTKIYPSPELQLNWIGAYEKKVE